MHIAELNILVYRDRDGLLRARVRDELSDTRYLDNRIDRLSDDLRDELAIEVFAAVDRVEGA